ncbi:MAG: U32 family peptidase [Bacilli bacterium]|nr:U32 family peptidase [Bacilli bacterium]
MNKIELLAPAGNMESLKAAIMAGCDAVYLGGHIFGARSFAGNFSHEEIIEAVKYAHLYNVKIYVTVNTLIYENEVDTFINYIDFLHRNNVDAVIIQDIGMMDLVRQTYPNLEIHASTQMHIHNIDGIRMLQKLGVKRAVIARETSIEVIKEIKKETKMDLEVFIHGALCFSYSGQCLISSLVGGRSGNRGTCAQVCRKKYSLKIDDNVVEKDKYLLSMKDLNTLNHISSLIESGVDSFKIEGRMKRPEYVYLVVSIYRKVIDSYLKDKKLNIDKELIKQLKVMFNREFTSGFLFNDQDLINTYRPNHMGILLGNVISNLNEQVKIKLCEDLTVNDGIRIIGDEDYGFIVNKIYIDNKEVKRAQKGDIVEIPSSKKLKVGSKVIKSTDSLLLKQINHLIKTGKRFVNINMNIQIKQNEPALLIVEDGINRVELSSKQTVERATKHVLTNDQILKQMNRLGDSIYKIDKITIDIDGNVFFPISVLNEMRRQTVQLLNEKRQYETPYLKSNYMRNVPSFTKETYKTVMIDNKKQYEKLDKKEYRYIYINNYELYKELVNEEKVFYILPRVIENYKTIEKRALIGELGALNVYDQGHSATSLNVVNSFTVAFLHSLGISNIMLSYEIKENQVNDLMKAYHDRYKVYPNLTVVIYGYEEVMISKCNLLSNYQMNEGYLIDEFDNEYQIEYNNNNTIIYNFRKRNLIASTYYEMGINGVCYNLINDKS